MFRTNNTLNCAQTNSKIQCVHKTTNYSMNLFVNHLKIGTTFCNIYKQYLKFNILRRYMIFPDDGSLRP
jgi:hypothetical protein